MKQTYANMTSRDPAPSLRAPVDTEVQAERDMISEAARPYREQITQEGALTMNGMPWWLPIAIIFAVYIAIQLWHVYHAQHGNSSTPDQRSL